MITLPRDDQGAEPAEYVLVLGLVVVPLIGVLWMLVRILFRYYSIGVGLVDLPFF
jgi:Flp pilus assembly pilin Flp